jgi:hypothetical protein
MQRRQHQLPESQKNFSVEWRCSFEFSGRRPHEQRMRHTVPALLSTRDLLRMVLFVLALPTGRRPFQGRTSVRFPWVFAVRAQRLPQPPPYGTAGSAGGIAHGASMQVSPSALKPIGYWDTLELLRRHYPMSLKRDKTPEPLELTP